MLRGILPGDTTTPPLASSTRSEPRTVPTSPAPSTSPGASQTPDMTASGSGAPSSAASSNPTNLPVPQDFTLMSMSFAGDDTILGIGSGTCSGPACPVVIKSVDNGRTWNAAASLRGADSPGRGALSHVGSDGAFTGIRMANPQIGWIFGGGLLRTTTGGSYWGDYIHEGAAVLDLATNGTDVVFTSVTGGCDATKCTGDLLIEGAPVGDARSRVITRIPLSVPLDSADVEFNQAGAAIVRALPVADAGGDWRGASYLVSGATVTQIDLDCPDSRGRYLAAAGGTMDFAACPGADARAFSISRAPQERMAQPSWVRVDGPPVNLGPGVFVSFAATDADNLLAASGGREGQGTMLLSHDGGATWREPADPAPLPDRGWRWVASPGADWFYAIPADPIRGFWRSTDAGESWSRVTLANG